MKRIVSEETKAKMRAAHLGKKHSQETKDKIGAKHRGKTITQETIEKQKATFAKSLIENGGGFSVGPRSTEFKEKMKKIANSRPREVQLAKAKQMQEARRGSKATPEQRERYSKARILSMVNNPSPKYFDTKPELEFEEELKIRGVEYKKQFHMSDPHLLYDFKIGDCVLVEIDGPYHYEERFHNSPEDFEYRINQDARKNLEAVRKGFKIFRIKVDQHLPDDWLKILKQQGFDLFEE